MKKRILPAVLSGLCVLLLSALHAQSPGPAVSIGKFQVQPGQLSTRLVMETDGQLFVQKAFYLPESPQTFVLDLLGAQTAATPVVPSSEAAFVRDIQVQRTGAQDLRVIIRLSERVPVRVFAEAGRTVVGCLSLLGLRTMYRILRVELEVRERRAQVQRPNYAKPELLATAPNQVWSWDITSLHGPTKWSYFQLYVILDIFSRYVVGWMLAHRESADLAERLIRETVVKQGIVAEQLTIHSDRGPSMRSQTVAQLLATLGITKSHSRPHVSDDNPFSESQFKTLKYRPEFPERIPLFRRPPELLRQVLPLAEPRTSPLGLGPADAGHGPLRAGRIQVAMRPRIDTKTSCRTNIALGKTSKL